MFEFTCDVCSRSFTAADRHRKTCSRACRDSKQRTGRAMGDATCKWCGTVFQKTITELRRPHRYDYCSKSCARFHLAPPVAIPELTTSFGHWFAGLTDGEGSFWFTASPQRIGFRFNITLRDDDRPILEYVQATLGFGRLYNRPARLRSNPATTFQTSSTAEAAVLEAIFTQFPLRSKKCRDFETWKRALHVVLNRGHRDLSTLIDLQAKLVEDRRYHHQVTS